MKKATILTLIILTLAVAAIADHKERDWQEGKLIDIKTESGRYTVQITYTIDSGDKYIYTASHQRRTNERRLPFTVNAKVKYAVIKEKVYLMDEEGKEHELSLDKKTLKE